ncbi:anthranilate synthase component I family protein [Candidatus Parcubacteria bacterium]|jgi:anthranilate synthase component I|nr:anthranilate synthase component I family protein [Candidatus Parcubacteria bacterium]MBT3948920.1 anthranilate synthase component I family protein [Candidatus Parcubacteria bacterium]
MNLPKIEIPKKPTYIHIADDMDFFELFKKLERKNDNCFLFESLGEKDRSSRYSVIGFDPEHIIRAKQNTLYFDDTPYEVENPYFALRDIVPQDIIARKYAGGLVGYMGYDCINYFEPSVSVKVHDKFDQFMFGVYTDGLVFDTMTNQLFYFYYTTSRLDYIKEIMNEEVKPSQVCVRFVKDTLTHDDHRDLVLSTKELIKQGYTFQCEVGFKSEYDISGDTIQIYEKLREVNPSPYMYHVKFGDKKMIGASPELLFSLSNGEAETHPLAGTIKRGETDLEDKQLARKLLNDEKEIAEHNMLVDMHRNDIGRISRFGSVNVRTLMDIKKFSHVQHIGSEVSGIICPEEDMFSGLSSLLPGGVLSGAPKIETVKIIDRQEPDARGPYGGAVGSFDFTGNCTFAIPIRTLFISGNYAYTQTCSGIVYDSKPECEYDEIQRKLAAMKQTLLSFYHYM